MPTLAEIFANLETERTETGVPGIPAGFQTTTTINWGVQPERAPTDQEREPEEMYGIPDDWDYRTAERNPMNEALPSGAIGWTPQGEAFYGNNLSGWWNGTTSRLFAPLETGRGGAAFSFWESTQLANEAFEELTEGNVLERILGFGAKGIGAISKLFQAPGQLTIGEEAEASAVGGAFMEISALRSS